MALLYCFNKNAWCLFIYALIFKTPTVLVKNTNSFLLYTYTTLTCLKWSVSLLCEVVVANESHNDCSFNVYKRY